MVLARESVKRLVIKSVASSSSWLRSISTSYLGTWKPTNNPREAQGRLARIRKEYKMQVSDLRKQYYNELQAQKFKDEARAATQRARMLAAKEQRKAAKKEQSQLLAVKRQKQQGEFIEMLRKERAEKAERRMEKHQLIEEKRVKEKERIRQKSSEWIDEKDLDRRIMEAIVDTTQL